MRKRNTAMARRQLRLHPFERQNLRRAWSEQAINASIHALTGEDVTKVVAKVGTLFYVVLGAALIEKADAETPDMRILRATVNTLGECADAPDLTHTQRGSLASGLEAVKRLIAGMQEESLFHAATVAQRILASGPVTLADFHRLTQQGAS